MKLNFSPGPAVLPASVRNELSSSLFDFKSSGIGIAEISHRSKEFEQLINETQELFKKLTNLGPEYKILFITGGANLQFSMLPMNLARSGKKAAYLLSGVWAEKAFLEAKKYTETIIAGSSKENGYKCLPTLNQDFAEQQNHCSYLHFTSNNTIYGTQYNEIPKSNIPLVCDASSDFLSKNIDYSQVKLWYACTQKNLGIAGLTLVAVDQNLLDENKFCDLNKIPQMLRYKVYADSNSLYNTPSCFAILACNLVLKWLDNLGGLEVIEKINNEKAQLLYTILDQYPIYRPYANHDARSKMNLTFNLETPILEEKFNSEAEQAGFCFLKGHRDVGGLRISIYNAQPIENCKILAEFMERFAQKYS